MGRWGLAVSAAGMIAFAGEWARAESPPKADELVVTAQEESIPAPLAVTAITGADLDRLGLEQFDALSRFVPGFAVESQSPNNPAFMMRGITLDSGRSFNGPRIAVIQDGVSISRSRGSYIDLLDVDRVEIARGPQSTLYGQDAVMGAVTVVQNKPDPGRTSADMRVSYGNYRARLAEAAVNLPMGEHAAIRVAGRSRANHGYVDNLLGGEDLNSSNTHAVRGALRLEEPGVTLDISGHYQRDRASGTSFKSIIYRPVDPATGAVIGAMRSASGAALAAAAGFEADRPLGGVRSVWGFIGKATITPSEALTLTSISAYRRFNAREILDIDGISLPLFAAADNGRGTHASQELRLQVDRGPLTALVGASYVRETGRQATPAQFDERMLLAVLTGRLSGPNPLRPLSDPAPAVVFADRNFTSAMLRAMPPHQGFSCRLIRRERSLRI
jgi:iron complex outermembrane recepter protein